MLEIEGRRTGWKASPLLAKSTRRCNLMMTLSITCWWKDVILISCPIYGDVSCCTSLTDSMVLCFISRCYLYLAPGNCSFLLCR